MAWSVDDIMQLTKFLTRKNQSGGISATDLFYAWNAEQASYFSDLLGRWQRASNGKSGIDTGLIENETIMTKLTPFTQIITGMVVSAGQAQKPSDFVYTLALRCNGAKIFQVDHDELWSVNQDVIDPPSIAANSYYYTEYQNYFSILPSTVTAIDMDYIQSPASVAWGFTLDVNNRQVYSPGLSTQPQWTTNSIVEITKRTLRNFGVSYASQDFENFGSVAVATGD